MPTAQPGRRKLASGPQVSSAPAGPEHRPVKPEAESGGVILGGAPSLVASGTEPAGAVGATKAVPEIVNAFWVDDSVVYVMPGGKMRRERAKFSLYVRDAELDLLKARTLREMRAVVGMAKEGDWHRIDCRDYEYRRVVLKGLEAHFEKHRELATYEGDMNPVKRALLDLGEYKVAVPRRCYLDIETDPRPGFSKREEMRILVACIVDGVTGEVVLREVLAEDTDQAEHRLLSHVFQVLDGYDQVVAWNGDRFDFPVIKARVKARGVKVPWKRWLWLDQMVLFKRQNTMAAESGEEKRSFALDAICRTVIGPDVGKHDFDARKCWIEWEAGGERRQKLVDYCANDTQLMWQLEQKTGYIDLLGTICEVTGTFPDSRGINPQQQVESYLARLAKARNFKPRTKKSAWEERAKEDEQKEEAVAKFRGAWVMKPKSKGFARNVHVCDFAGLYPNIILSWNMSPETRAPLPVDPNISRPAYLPRVEWDPEQHRPHGVASAPGTGVWFDQSAQGLLAAAVAEMMRLRKYWNDLKAKLPPRSPESRHAERMSSAYKIAINSFYGVVGAPTSAYFVREVAESVAQAGVWLIQQTIAFAESKGLVAIYGDTDSAFIVGTTEDAFRKFAQECNEVLYPRLLELRGCTRNHISLAYEKEFEWVVFSAPKKYVGKFLHYKGTRATEDSEPEIKGLEYNRGDSARLAGTLQKQVIDLMAAHEDRDGIEPYVAAVEAMKARVLTGELAVEDFVISKSLGKSLTGKNGYKARQKKDGTAAAQPPQVEIAKVLKERGHDVGEGAKIEYYCADGSCSPKKFIPAEDYGKEGVPPVDRYEIWEGAVYPATMRLLVAAFPGEPTWGRYESVRPPKPRVARGKGVSKDNGTLDLFGGKA
jgi:DNA polymerase elongation subunit (family B)